MIFFFICFIYYEDNVIMEILYKLNISCTLHCLYKRKNKFRKIVIFFFNIRAKVVKTIHIIKNIKKLCSSVNEKVTTETYKVVVAARIFILYVTNLWPTFRKHQYCCKAERPAKVPNQVMQVFQFGIYTGRSVEQKKIDKK